MSVKYREYTVQDLVDLAIIEKPLDGNHGEIHPKGGDFVSSGIPFIMASDINDSLIDFTNCKFISKEQSKKLRKGFSREGDVLLTHKASIGRTAIVPESEWEYILLTPQVTYYRVKDKSKLDNEYLKYYFDSKPFQSVLAAFSGAGSTRAYIGITEQLNLPVKLPDVKIQEKIASVLSSLDHKIELNNRINIELESMAKTLYDYWFVQFDFPNTKGKPYKTRGGKMVYNDELKREIPVGWEVDMLNNYIELILDHRGKTPKKLGGDWVNKGEGVIALSAKIVKGGKLTNLAQANRVDFEMYERWMPEKLKSGDILMTSEAPLGEFYFILDKTDYCMSQRLFAIRADQSKILPSYLYYELSKGNGYSQIIGSQSGSTVFGIRQDELRKIKVLKPDISTQQDFDKIITPILQQIKNNDSQNQELADLRNWLLPMLLNGQVKIRQAVKEEQKTVRANQTQWQTLLLARYINALKDQKPKPILQGEVGIAKYAYLADKIFGVGSGFKYKQHNFGPYDSAINDRLSSKKYFQKTGDRFYKVFDLTASGEELAGSTNVDFSKADMAMRELTAIFSKFTKDKAHKLELMASICWQIEKQRSISAKKIWQGFKNWKIAGRKEKHKAEVFTEVEVKNCLKTIVTKGWHKKLVR